MASIILDSSVTIAWLFDEDAAGSRIKSILDRNDLIAPWLWRLEVTNVVLVRERQHWLSEAQAVRLLQLLDDLEIDLVPEPANRTSLALAQTARPYQLSSYDAVYLDLAMRLGLALFTRDNNLCLAARRVGVQLVAEQLARP